jgi:hypothetical protein
MRGHNPSPPERKVKNKNAVEKPPPKQPYGTETGIRKSVYFFPAVQSHKQSSKPGPQAKLSLLEMMELFQQPKDKLPSPRLRDAGVLARFAWVPQGVCASGEESALRRGNPPRIVRRAGPVVNRIKCSGSEANMVSHALSIGLA